MPDELHHIGLDAASLMACTSPIEGDYRERHYRTLVDEAIDQLAVKFLKRPSTNTSMLAHTTCCNTWGEKRTIEKHNHPPWKIISLSKKSNKKIMNRDDLREAIVGQEPEDPAMPWKVAFPKTLAKCTYFAQRNYKIQFEALQSQRKDSEGPREATESLGKRDASELKTLPFESTMDGR